MLEDPTYSSVVRWGDEGDSFVVLEVRILSNKVEGWEQNKSDRCAHRTNDLPNRSFPNTSNTATLHPLYDSSISTTFTKCDKTMKIAINLHMVQA